MSDDLAGVLFRHRERLKEIANVLSRYGFARLADHAAEAGEPALPGGFSPAWPTLSWRL
jgi:hypothetical protein